MIKKRITYTIISSKNKQKRPIQKGQTTTNFTKKRKENLKQFNHQSKKQKIVAKLYNTQRKKESQNTPFNESQNTPFNNSINKIKFNKQYNFQIGNQSFAKLQKSCQYENQQMQFQYTQKTYINNVQNEENQKLNKKESFREDLKQKEQNFFNISSLKQYQTIIQIDWKKNNQNRQNQNVSPDSFIVTTQNNKNKKEIEPFLPVQGFVQTSKIKEQKQTQQNQEKLSKINIFLNHLNAKIIQKDLNISKAGSIKKQRSADFNRTKKQFQSEYKKQIVKKNFKQFDNKHKEPFCSVKKLKFNYLDSDYFHSKQKFERYGINFQQPCFRNDRKSTQIYHQLYNNRYFNQNGSQHWLNVSNNKKNKNMILSHHKKYLLQANLNQISPIKTKGKFNQLFKQKELNQSATIQQEIIKTPNLIKFYQNHSSRYQNQSLFSLRHYFQHKHQPQKTFQYRPTQDLRPQEQLSIIFNLLDQNRSGIISKFNYAIQSLNQQVQNILISVTNKIRFMKKQYNKQDFIEQVWSLVQNVYFSFVKEIFQQQISINQKQVNVKKYQQEYFNQNNYSQRFEVIQQRKKRAIQQQKIINKNHNHNRQFFSIHKQKTLDKNYFQKDKEIRYLQRLNQKVCAHLKFFTTKIDQFSRQNWL